MFAGEAQCLNPVFILGEGPRINRTLRLDVIDFRAKMFFEISLWDFGLSTGLLWLARMRPFGRGTVPGACLRPFSQRGQRREESWLQTRFWDRFAPRPSGVQWLRFECADSDYSDYVRRRPCLPMSSASILTRNRTMLTATGTRVQNAASPSEANRLSRRQHLSQGGPPIATIGAIGDAKFNPKSTEPSAPRTRNLLQASVRATTKTEPRNQGPDTSRRHAAIEPALQLDSARARKAHHFSNHESLSLVCATSWRGHSGTLLEIAPRAGFQAWIVAVQFRRRGTALPPAEKQVAAQWPSPLECREGGHSL